VSGPLGISFAPGTRLALPDFRDLALLAEAQGYDSLWVPETWGYDAVSLLASLAPVTRSIRLASGVLTVYSRSPALLAQTAATLQALSNHRFILGLGASGPIVIEGWHGVPYGRPLRRTREVVDVVRLALSGARVDTSGSVFHLHGFRLAVPAHSVPIALAALGPRNVTLAGEIADIWLPIFALRGQLPAAIAHLRAGEREAGRPPGTVLVAPYVPALVGPRAESLLRRQLAYYVGGMGTFYARHLARAGFGDAVRRVRDLWTAGERGAAAAALGDDLLARATVGLSGDPRAALQGFRDEGADLPILAIPHGAAAAEVADTVRALRPSV